MSESVSILRDILTTLREIRDVLRSGGASSGRGTGRAPGGEVAPDSDLDGQYGDPSIRKDPRNWKGPSFVGCSFSAAPPEYLEDLAGLFDWMAGKDEESDDEKKKKSARYKRLDAKRARGWAQRIRNGWKPTAASQPSDEGAGQQDYGGGSDSDIPF